MIPVATDGWDNRTYRLGDEMTVRLPTHQRYVAGVEKEDRWLPRLAPHLPVAIPEPIATGRPGPGYRFPWSIRRWLDGEPAARDRIADLDRFAETIGRFLLALQQVDTRGGPVAGAHSFYRGAGLAHYDDETRRALVTLDGMIDTDRAAATWEAALSTTWQRPPVWFHGDVAVGNLLVRDGRLAAVIDFGTCGVGDPACDLVIAWTLFAGTDRRVFRQAVGLDPATWARGRGWALWKALITLVGQLEAGGRSPGRAAEQDIIAQVLADHDE